MLIAARPVYYVERILLLTTTLLGTTGYGIRASHRLFEIFRLVGIHDVSARMPRGRNPMNSVKACIKALQSQKDPGQIALGRGKKMVDVRKVYFGEDTSASPETDERKQETR